MLGKLFLVSITLAHASDDTLVNTAVQNLLDTVLTQSSITAADRERVTTLLDDCRATTSPLTKVLDDAVAATNKCTESAFDKATEPYLTAGDNERFHNCTFKTRDVFLRHGGVNFLAEPEITSANISILRSCADGTGTLGTAFGIVLNRYTPCSLEYNATDTAIFDRALASSTRMVGESRSASLRQVCSNLVAFEDLNSVVARFTASSVSSFLESLTDLSQQR